MENADAAAAPCGAPITKGRAWEGMRVEQARARSCEFLDVAHDDHQVVVMLDADMRGSFAVSPRLRVDGTAVGGNVFVVPSGQPHSAEGEGHAEWLSIRVDPALVARAAAEAGAPASAVVGRWASRDPVIWQVAKALVAELDECGPADRLLAESLAMVLAVHLVRRYSEAGPLPEGRFAGGLAGSRLRRATEFVRDNLDRAVSIAEMAREAGLSPFHFAREFKRSTGLTPHEYVTRARVERAKRLLRDTDLPLVEIGLRSGFASQSHFTRLFRKLAATTPGAFRRAAR